VFNLSLFLFLVFNLSLFLVLSLQPDWMVLRDGKEADLLARPGFTRQYECVIAMSARARLAVYGRYWGDSYPNTDAFFAIFRRKAITFR